MLKVQTFKYMMLGLYLTLTLLHMKRFTDPVSCRHTVDVAISRAEQGNTIRVGQVQRTGRWYIQSMQPTFTFFCSAFVRQAPQIGESKNHASDGDEAVLEDEHDC